ncbi:MAG: hypothetical protein PSV36_00120 [Algoriphagus sp.]|nr:hypothetical protein [Algoriphagus sp.]
MIPNHNPYRASILETIHSLSTMEAEVISKTLSILMAGEWKEMHETFEEGKKFGFTLTQLGTSTDQNVVSMVKLIKNLRKTINKLQTQNNIPDEEVEF